MVVKSHQDWTLKGTQDGEPGTLVRQQEAASFTGAGFTEFEPIALFSVGQGRSKFSDSHFSPWPLRISAQNSSAWLIFFFLFLDSDMTSPWGPIGRLTPEGSSCPHRLIRFLKENFFWAKLAARWGDTEMSHLWPFSSQFPIWMWVGERHRQAYSYNTPF